MKYTASEIFTSIQGEGHYTGRLTTWIRFFLCNLQCQGFMQDDPTRPETWINEYETIDISNITDVSQIPVVKYGCDSAFSWAKRYKHLYDSKTAIELANMVTEKLKSNSNPDGLFLHPISKQQYHMCFTGGEPLMKQNQSGIQEILQHFIDTANKPNYVTIETNGTQVLTEQLKSFINANYCHSTENEWFWSVSPKLWTVSGEKREKAIKVDCVKEYQNISPHGQLKFVINGTKDSWNELEEVIQLFREGGVNFPVWIMPVGATQEQQELPTVSQIADEAILRGYNVSGRMHCYLWNNPNGK